MTENKSGKLGLLVGGGPAPGINGVISAATIAAREKRIQVIGFMDGFKWLSISDREPIEKHIKQLDIPDVTPIMFKGGSILGTSRKNPTKDPREMQNVINAMLKLEVTSLVVIGGDDTAYSASQVFAQAGGRLRVAHVPKTIDNDLPLPGSTPTFGFETARHYGTVLLRNLAEDAKTTSRWYLVVSMGRAAGHLALGIGKAGAATLTVIPEEFESRKCTLELLCDIIIGAIIKRKSKKSHFGVVVLAEGLIESLGEQELLSKIGEEYLSNYGLRRDKNGHLERDEHNHLRLGEIAFGRLMKDRLTPQLEELKIKTTFIDKDLGYELRCADPIPFDAEYTRDLGYGAVKFLCSDEAPQYVPIISFVQGKMNLLRYEDLMNPETKRLKNRNVNVHAESYECALRYMIRLERGDFEDPEKLLRLATEASMTPEQFRERFGKVVGL